MEQKKLDNQGNTFLLVIICIIFIAMLGSVLLSITFVNAKVKYIRKQESKAFYSCEMAIDEIKTGISQDTASSIQKAYSKLLTVYTTGEYATDEEVRNTYLYENTKSNLLELLNIEKDQINDGNAIVSMLKSRYLTQPDQYMIDADCYIDYDTSENELTIKNLKVALTKDTSTYVMTDLVITIPEFTGESVESGSISAAYSDYAILADTAIQCFGSSNLCLIGNLYAGDGGISVSDNSTNLKIYSDRIVTSGDISSLDQASMQIDSKSESQTEIWAQNLVTDQTFHSDAATTLKVAANNRYNSNELSDSVCLIADDLLVNAKNSEVSLNGEYIGYTSFDDTRDISETADDVGGSAISVNGAGSALDLSSLTRLLLRGYSYITFPQNQLFDYTTQEYEGTTDSLSSVILTGQAIGVKNNQRIYLVPDRYIVNPNDTSGEGSNPMLYEDFSSSGVDGDVSKVVDLTQLESDLPSELASTYEVKSVIYSALTTKDKVVYFYLSFSDPADAMTYFEYCSENSEFLGATGSLSEASDIYDPWYQIGSGTFALSQIQLPSTSVIDSTGIVVDYITNADGSRTQEIISGDEAELTEEEQTAREKVELSFGTVDITNLSVIFEHLTQTLDPSLSGTKTVYNYYVNAEQIKTDEASSNTSYAYNKIITKDYEVVDGSSGSTNEKYHVIITDGDVTVESAMKGIIIANGDVTVKNQFQGTILSGGTVSVTASATVQADADMVSEILNYIGNDISTYLNLSIDTEESTDSGTGAAKVMDLSNLVTYKNWKSGL